MTSEDDVQERRRSALRAWVAAHGQVADIVRARRLKPSAASYLSQLMGGYAFGEKAARNWERNLGMPHGYLDAAPHHQNDGQRIDAALAQVLIDSSRMIDAPTKAWESILSGDLRQRFKLEVRDDSMSTNDAGSLEIGDFAIFDPERAPTAGKSVLLADADGNLYIRQYAPRTPTHWAGVARNSAYQHLDSVRDRLRILAVQVGYLEKP